MGQVYQATDTKLNRQVALKILPEAFATDPDRLARFQREAQVLASLNHPGIAAIYGLEESDDTRALVLELVEGPTLADRIAKGPIPVDEALPIAKQIAEALEAAHEAGVIHRDLKPANIKVKDDGTVKVLDFGLAKALDTTPQGDPSQSPTLTAAATQTGVILGTAAYMSPEQARGKPVDRRADIWAFGVVVYEMLTGARPFQGEDVSLTLASVMKSDVDVKRLPLDLPETLRTVLRRCLEKDPLLRIRDMGDVRLAMAGAFETTAVAATVVPAVSQPRAWRQALPWVAGASLAIVTGLAGWYMRAPTPPRVGRFGISVPANNPLRIATNNTDVAISLDGTRIAYIAGIGNGQQLYVRSLHELQETPLASGDLFSPFFSPDSEWVGFYDRASGRTLQRVSVFGGPTVPIAQLSGVMIGASWRADDTIVFAIQSGGTGLLRVPAVGGEPEALTTPNESRGELRHGWPSFLPGGRALLYTVFTGPTIEDAQIAVLNLDTGEETVLLPGSNPHYSPTGHIVYGAAGALMAVGFDLARLEVTASPVPVLDGVVIKDSGAVDFSLAEDGSLVYVAGAATAGGTAQRTLVWVDRQGQEEPLSAPPRTYNTPRLSPDGTRVALEVRGRERDIWIWDLARGTLTRLTFDPANESGAVWTPDGRHIAFGSELSGSTNLFWKAADGTGSVERLTDNPNNQFPQAFSPDGRLLLFLEGHPDTGADLAVLSMEGNRPTEPLLVTEFNERNSALSPDGRWMAYESNASGQNEIYVRPFPDVNQELLQISTGGGTQAVWAPDGQELFYRSNTGLMVVPVEREPSFATGVPELMVEEQYYRGGGIFGTTTSRQAGNGFSSSKRRRGKPPRAKAGLR